MTKVDFKLPPIAVKVTSLFKPQKKDVPMFNQPLASGCPHHRISRVLYAISLSLLIAIAIPVVTLKALTYSFIEENRDTGFVFETTEEEGGAGMSIVMAALPRQLHHVPAKLALVAAVLSIFSSAAHLGFVVVDWKTGNRVCSHLASPTMHSGSSCVMSNQRTDTSLGLSPQHYVPPHHEQHPRPLRSCLDIRNAQINVAFP
jgi:hypothetical protein